MIPEYSSVVLLEDRPDEGLRSGDVGVVVHNYASGDRAEVEFMTLNGDTIAVLPLPFSAFRAASQNEIPHVRSVEAAE